MRIEGRDDHTLPIKPRTRAAETRHEVSELIMPSGIKHLHRREHDLRGTLASMFDWARENPLPVAAIGAGLGAILTGVIRKAGRGRVQGRRSDLGAARAPEALGVFKGHEADWMFQRTLAYMNVGAAEINECLHTARRIDERDPESWPSEWAEVAARVDAQGDQARPVWLCAVSPALPRAVGGQRSGVQEGRTAVRGAFRGHQAARLLLATR